MSGNVAASTRPRAPTPRVLVWLFVFTALTHHGCRDDVPPFEPRDDFALGEPRITFNPGHDRTPGWSPRADSILYSAERLVGGDTTRGALVAAPRRGGRVRVLFPALQGEGAPTPLWLLAPAPRPDRSELAFAQVVSLWKPHPADPNFLGCAPSRSAQEAARPPLQTVAVRVRSVDTGGSIERGASIRVDAEGVSVDAEARISVSIDHPFQQIFRRDSAAVFRPSWSPDGERVVFSDGLRLLIWTPDEGSVRPIPGTHDAVWPAWSPDGQWIAFTRLERADSTDVLCRYVSNFGLLLFTQERKEYVIGRHLLSIVRPDGGEQRELGEGDEPAWAPDSHFIYFAHQNGIWRSAIDGALRERVPDTEGGREPVVSADGNFLAFSRMLRDEGEVVPDYEIFVIPLAE